MHVSLQEKCQLIRAFSSLFEIQLISGEMLQVAFSFKNSAKVRNLISNVYHKFLFKLSLHSLKKFK